MAKGVQRDGQFGKVRIVVSFDQDTFDEINRRAEKERTSFAEQVRTLIEWGLESEEEGAPVTPR